MVTKAFFVTDMIKKLFDKNIEGVNLIEKGTSVAISIVRKHRLWEVFLAEKFNFIWDEVHEVAKN